MTKMPEAQARAVLWPFATPRRSIGDLIDRGLLNARDLRQAAHVAYSRKLKAACLAMLEVLAQPDQTTSTSTVPLTQPVTISHPPAIPEVCPLCGSAVRVDSRWTSPRHGVGWRCEQGGLSHCLQLRYLTMLKTVYAPDAWIIPPAGDYTGVRRCDLDRGPIGYWPQADR
jgi:hypothetical protein